MLVGVVLASLIALPFQLVGNLLSEGGGFDPIKGFVPGAFALSLGCNLIGGAIGFPVYAGLYWAAIKQIRGEPISINDLFKGFSHFVPLLAFGLVYNALLVVACMLCGFPIVFAMGLTAPCALLIMDRGFGPTQAISESFRVLGGQAWLLGLFMIVAGFALGVIGFLMCCVGILITMPVYFVCIALHYNYFWPTQAPQPHVMPEM